MTTTDSSTGHGSDFDRLAAVAKDAAYVAVGFAVLGFQKAQVRRRELTEQLDQPLQDGRKRLNALLEAIGTNTSELDRQAQLLESRVDGVVTQVLAHLPAPADAVATRVHETVVAARTHVRQFVLAA